jgi:uncharacterized protein YbjT (DUF2867 family)
MRIVVVGGSGLIGDKVMTALHDAGHQAVAASPAFGIDAFTGEGLDGAMAGADVVVDVSNAPDWEDEKVLRFFTTVTRNALKAGRHAGARHHVALSVLGCDRLPESGYMRAKVAQEELIRSAGTPFTIVRSTQFMQFLARVAAPEGDVVDVPDTQVQPIAAVEVARFVADPSARYVGAVVRGHALLPGPEARIATVRLGDWLASRSDKAVAAT